MSLEPRICKFVRLRRDLRSDQKVFERFVVSVSDNGNINVRVVGDQKPALHKNLFEFWYTWVVGGDE